MGQRLFRKKKKNIVTQLPIQFNPQHKVFYYSSVRFQVVFSDSTLEKIFHLSHAYAVISHLIFALTSREECKLSSCQLCDFQHRSFNLSSISKCFTEHFAQKQI